MDPLIVPVVVRTEHIEHFRTAAKLGRALSGQHVPGLELRAGAGCRPPRVLRAARHDMDDRIDGKHARVWSGGAHRVDSCNGGAHELALELRPAAACAGIHAPDLPSRPSKIGDLIDWGKQWVRGPSLRREAG